MPTDNVLFALVRLARVRGDDMAFCDPDGGAISYGALLSAVTAVARDYRRLPNTVALMAPNGIEWVVAYLALMWAGKTIVPLPEFFSPDQLAHIIVDANVGHVVATSETAEAASGLGPPVTEIDRTAGQPDRVAGSKVEPAFEPRLVVYTSGSTGRPKGVRIGGRQLTHSARVLGAAIGARPDDTYLSILPMSLLLEQICAVHVSLRTGVRVIFGARLANAETIGEDLCHLVERVAPSLMVLVPQILGAWTTALAGSGRSAPESLRIVATGGAPVTDALAAAAWSHGIPVHEGYGLSECCAVVALNRPGDRAAGTVGRPLDGLDVTLDDGEIVVRGPTVMDGYLNEAGAETAATWHTGDMGAFDSEGRLVVRGRKDSMLVTQSGHNVVPEWIEAMVTADPRIAHCILCRTELPFLTAIVVPRASHTAVFQDMTAAEIEAHVARLAASAPAYARPVRCVVAPEADLRRQGLLTANGLVRRADIGKAFASRMANVQNTLAAS